MKEAESDSRFARDHPTTDFPDFPDFGAFEEIQRFPPASAPIDAPAQHLVPFRSDSEPAKLGHCRIPERILGGVSVA
jgi:hypothetical protein